MKLAIMQPYFLPYLGYFQLIKEVEKYVIYDDVNFFRGYVKRNNMLLNGQSHLFTLIVLKASQNKLINEIYLADDQSKLLKTIVLSYKKAPQFSSVLPLIEKIFGYEDRNLARFVGNSIMQIADYLHLVTEFIYSSNIIEKDNSLKAQDKILNICKILGATHYINAIGGRMLYDHKSFEKEKIDLRFLLSNPVQYKQFKNSFVSHLSILDVLMFNSVEKTNELLSQYELIQ